MTRLICARVEGGALRANLQVVRARAPGCRVMAVVKANAYGHGLVSSALALAQADADALAVARLEEALALRAAGLSGRIVLLEGVFSAAQLAEAAPLRLDLVVHQEEQIALLERYRGPVSLDVWVKVDTGMNRLGFRPERFRAAWERLTRLNPPPQLRVLTHLAGAEEQDGQYTAGQLARLAPLTAGLAAEVSIANSAGILAQPATHAQWVRPGLALYGVSPFAGRRGADFGLRPAMTLQSSVIAVREVLPGERVGYGGAWRAERRSRLAIIAAGYGDGLLRSLGNGAPVLIDGRRAPLAGRVSMDMIAVDVTDLPAVAVGERVELWGAGLAVEEMAAAAGTIPYELLCAVSQRVPIEVV
ncbi:MAG TPA: alanine racemase [Steroidobacteraceae bacterium]|nr:alanine racemase [Steroidobacteraceae bacterium]